MSAKPTLKIQPEIDFEQEQTEATERRHGLEKLWNE
jgi:hypothetical protein